MPLTDAERTELGKIGAAARLATEDPVKMTEAARKVANYDRYYNKTDPSLPEPERHRRALALREKHMASMRLARMVNKRKATEHTAVAAALADAAARVAS